MAKIKVCLSFDFDAISIWVGPKNTRSPNLISRGEFGARVGAQRMLKLLSDEGVPSTWFIPGHTIDTFPEICQEIADAGHEVGYHGYCHEGPTSKRPLEDERTILLRSMECIERISGKAPVGHRLPGGNLGERWTKLLLENGFIYDSSMAPHDFAPTYHRLGDVPNTDSAYEFGDEVDLVILPFDWNMDDAPYFSYEPGSGRPGLRSPDEVRQIWQDEFDYLYQRIGEGVYVLTMHPQTTGKGSRMLMLERLIAHIKSHNDVEFATLASVAAEYRTKIQSETTGEQMNNLFDLTGKVSLVTGGSRGIGLAIAQGLAAHGSQVVIWDVDDKRNNEATAILETYGTKIGAKRIDVTDELGVAQGVGEVVAEFGRIDVLVANAGISNAVKSFLDLSIDTFREVTAVNMEGWFLTVREVLKHMKERADAGDPGGSIIGQSSLQALHGSPGNEHYGATKGAVLAMIKGIAVEFGRYGVTANALMPGFIKTEMNKRNHDNVALYEKVIKRMPIGRWGTPEDLVGLAVYLASDAARYHSGTAIELDGGV